MKYDTALGAEPALDPERAIIDPHLHLWDIPALPGLPQAPQRFLLPEAADTIARSGHRITHAVFVECHAMYRSGGPQELRSLGETEFANGMAAMSESGQYGSAKIAHRIVGNIDLRLGDGVSPVLEAHTHVAGRRFRGVRMNTAFSDHGLFGAACDPSLRHMLIDKRFQAGAAVLARAGLTLDVWCLDTQLGEVAALADAVPDLVIVLDHLGTIDWREDAACTQARRRWTDRIEALARRPNVRVKLGGLGMAIDRPIGAETGKANSAELAAAWRPMIETCIAAFGPARAMFESNYPPDRAAGSYGVIWNAFKRIAAGCSMDEQDRLFRRTAADTYDIEGIEDYTAEERACLTRN